MKQYYFTEKGYQKIKNEIDELEKYIKNDIAKEIATAREHGDLKENAEYKAAREKQANTMVRLGQMQERFMNARIIRREDLPEDTVTLGKQVKILDLNSGQEVVYIILGDGETDIDKGIISYLSPIAQALINHKVDDEVEVQLPRAIKQFKIISIDFFEIG